MTTITPCSTPALQAEPCRGFIRERAALAATSCGRRRHREDVTTSLYLGLLGFSPRIAS
uniref:Uncharacterized protein n=1 Tax=Hyaloperonospora arabidopsidis (strain Emoy2) TaxID=559515 RepID=M4BHA0_HYAAE